MRSRRIRATLTSLGVAFALSVVMVFPTLAATTTVTVGPADLASDKATAYTNGKWFLYNDENDQIDNSLGSFVVGPATPPLGTDSLQISVSGTQRRNIATYRFKGTLLSDITTLRYSTYNPSAGNGGAATRSGYLQFNVDFNGSDTWQSRLVYVPSQNGTVVQNSWQEWDAISGGNALWRYSGAGGAWPGGGPALKTWNQILAQYPGIRIRVTDSFLGIRVGEPYGNGYTENIDKFVFGTASDTTTFDFEAIGPATDKDQCKNNGWRQFNDPAYKNQGDCVSSVTSGR